MKHILKIITEWDPVGLMSSAPANEYHVEAKAIEDFLNKNENISVDELSEYIENLFIEYFGDDTFTSRNDEIYSIAEKILKNKDNDSCK